MKRLLAALIGQLTTEGKVECLEQNEHFARVIVTTPQGIIVERDLHASQLHHAVLLKAVADDIKSEIEERTARLQGDVLGT
ncbi:hypothetical protein IQ22_00157 [Pseudomonas duriflava]|uniref:Uncharacterized protein n=1 Tax=Pseudomonas duriflava TaxID=459528 RepID=A0A562QP60_9PSED|nr:hypothetical protein [Pseudomonas duriflava]TWI58453.1 hypothetical protein IQ22_00157 [Pseudomonas duriflava]